MNKLIEARVASARKHMGEVEAKQYQNKLTASNHLISFYGKNALISGIGVGGLALAGAPVALSAVVVGTLYLGAVTIGSVGAEKYTDMNSFYQVFADRFPKTTEHLISVAKFFEQKLMMNETGEKLFSKELEDARLMPQPVSSKPDQDSALAR